MEGHTKKMFHVITGMKTEEMDGKKYVEFGCGPGRFLDIVLKNGGIATGLDLSLAVESAYDNLGDNPNVLIVQGDIFSPPFPRDFFDGGYSIGVFHHTPDPESGVHSLCSVVKHEGSVSVSVYPKTGLYNAFSTLHTRKTMVALRRYFGEKIGYKIAMIYSKISAYLLHTFLIVLQRIPYIGGSLVSIITEYFCVVTFIPDINWRILDTFDAITPEYASTHTSKEVRDWLRKAGCKDIIQSVWGETSYQAVKSGKKIELPE
jgi:SAM-dependent methyltransferase